MDWASNLVARSRGELPLVQPVAPGLFEPAAAGRGGYELEVEEEIDAPAPGLPPRRRASNPPRPELSVARISTGEPGQVGAPTVSLETAGQPDVDGPAAAASPTASLATAAPPVGVDEASPPGGRILTAPESADVTNIGQGEASPFRDTVPALRSTAQRPDLRDAAEPIEGSAPSLAPDEARPRIAESPTRQPAAARSQPDAPRALDEATSESARLTPAAGSDRPASAGDAVSALPPGEVNSIAQTLPVRRETVALQPAAPAVDEATVIQISIGRIEVRATQTAQAAPREAGPAPVRLSLDEYLRGGRGDGR